MSAEKHAVREISGPQAFAAAFSVSRETLDRLKTYESALQLWQKTINLVAPSTLGHVWHRHFADSAQLVALAPPAPKTWVDLGSGAGFPGLVVAILLAPEAKTRVTLVESDARKAAFLREVARQVAVPVDIFCERAEQAATRVSLHACDVVSARAVAPLTRLLALAKPFTGAHTVCLFPKGRDANTELQDAEIAWKFNVELGPSLTDSDARIAIIRELTPRR